MGAPKVRKHLSADALFARLRNGWAKMDEHRSGTPDIPWRDALLSAFAMFARKSPSLLACDQERAEGHVQGGLGIERVPCDTAMRERRDPMHPDSLRPLCTQVFGARQRRKALEEMVCVENHDLLALDGTGYFASQQMHGESCLQRQHQDGSSTYHHQMRGAELIHPAKRAVIPLMPEPISQQDGSTQHDCERHAAKR